MRFALAAAALALVGVSAVSDASAENFTDHFTVVAKNDGGKLTVDIASKDGWYVNTEYPMKLTLTAPDGVKLGKSELKKEDAKLEGTEKKGKAKKASFSTTASADKPVSGKYKIVVCSDKTCSPPLKGEFRAD